MSPLYLGVAAGLAGSISINTGNNLQSLGLHQLEIPAAKGGHKKKKAALGHACHKSKPHTTTHDRSYFKSRYKTAQLAPYPCP